MSDLEPPDWFDSAPPPSGGEGEGGGRRRRPQVPKLTPDQISVEAGAFFTWLTAPDRVTEFKILLPEKTAPAVFIDACKTAVTKKPQYLRPDWRPSLMMGVMDAANCGLMPDGKEGAIVPRYDSDAHETRLVFQPMVWGIVKLGRETGAIKSIRAKIVFFGEPFRVLEGETDIIEHEANPDISEAAYTDLYGGLDKVTGNVIAKPDVFMGHVRAAYCFIVGTDGTVTKRWMTRARLVILKNASRAKNGPWNSAWIDEMILKAVILYTTKWINLDVDTASARRFQSALAIDAAADIADDDAIERPDHSEPLALAAPGPKLDMFAEMFSSSAKEKASVVDRQEPIQASVPSTATAAPKEPDTPPADNWDAVVEGFIAVLRQQNRDTMAKFSADPKFRRFTADLGKSGRNDLIVKARDEAIAANERDP